MGTIKISTRYEPSAKKTIAITIKGPLHLSDLMRRTCLLLDMCHHPDRSNITRHQIQSKFQNYKIKVVGFSSKFKILDT